MKPWELEARINPMVLSSEEREYLTIETGIIDMELGDALRTGEHVILTREVCGQVWTWDPTRRLIL